MGQQVRDPDKTLDIQGVAGRRVGSLAGQALGSMRPGQVLKLITSARDARSTIDALCREAGYLLLEANLEGTHYSFLIQR
jgi:TusA-related sulfurtransferase